MHIKSYVLSIRCLYVSIVVVALLVSGGVLTAFLYPRNVDISVVSINASADYINGLTASLKDNVSDVAKLNIQVKYVVVIILILSIIIIKL